jgi:hypothetical protein
MPHNPATRELHRLAHSVIFDPHAAWPLCNKQVERVWKSLAEWGITEESSGITRFTDPAARPEIEILLSCIGAYDPWEIPFSLEEHGHASEEEACEVWEADSESEGLRLLKILIFRAYFRRFVQSVTSH